MDIKLNYVEMGEGFPLVMLHGNGEDHTYFNHQMEPFSQRFRLIIPETRGHGGSPRGTAPFTLAQFAEDLKAFLDGLGITKCHLLGFSDGGNIATLFALKYPQYVEKLILNGSNLEPSGINQDFQDSAGERWAQLQKQSPLEGAELQEWELLDLMVTQPHIDPKSLSALTMPVLVLVGEQDVIQKDHTRLIAASIPGSKLTILPGDHFIAHENWQAYNPVVLEFLENA